MKKPGETTVELDPTDAASFLEAADRIGCRLCRDALWAGDRCNWMTWTSEIHAGQPMMVHRSAYPNRFDGVAGIALFLAHLQQRTNDNQQRIALGGAIRQVRAVVPNLTGIGNLAGPIGVATALISIGERIGDESLAIEGLAIMEAATYDDPATVSLDVFDGCAGAILALVDVARRYERPALLDKAGELGQVLVDRALHGHQGVHWSSLATRTPLPTGFLHGSAGLIAALFKLDQAKPDPRWQTTASRALAHDRATMESNPDVSWSQGSTGIGISRLMIRQVTGDDPQLLDEIESSISKATTALATHAMIVPTDLSLCHGLTGLADFLFLAATDLGQTDLQTQARDFGRAIVEQIHQTNKPWPCGVPGAPETPDLMLGTAGIGWFFLRLLDQSVVLSLL